MEEASTEKEYHRFSAEAEREQNQGRADCISRKGKLLVQLEDKAQEQVLGQLTRRGPEHKEVCVSTSLQHAHSIKCTHLIVVFVPRSLSFFFAFICISHFLPPVLRDHRFSICSSHPTLQLLAWNL